MVRVDRPRGTLVVAVLGALAGSAVSAGLVRRVGSRGRRSTAVLGVDDAAGVIRFAPTPDALLPGRYSFWFAEGRGHARVDGVVRRERGAVVRELLGVDAGDVTAARDGRFNGWLHLTPDGLGAPWRSERVQTTQGAVPAWVVPGGDGTRWAVLVHGRSSVRQEALRAVPAFLAAGFTALLPAYRGDGEAPEGRRPRYAVPDAEWVDVESAILHALDRGATEVVLAAWSSGASIALATAQRSRVRSVVSGVVLDSPVLGPVIRRGRGVAVAVDAAALEVPVLVLASADDGVAPIDGALALAAERPDLVRLVVFHGARHTRLWNLDPERWERAVRAWLEDDDAALEAVTAPRTTSGRRGGRSRREAGRRGSPAGRVRRR